MSLNLYQQLQQQAAADKTLLGCQLPVMIEGHLACQSTRLDGAQVLAAITEFAPVAGWFVLRDRVEIAATAPTDPHFIEGEWCKENDSLKVRLIQHDQYQLTRMTLASASPSTDRSYAYHEQISYLRPNLATSATGNRVIYRQWWQQDLQQGGWMPYVQQFVGFHCAAEPVTTSTQGV